MTAPLLQTSWAVCGIAAAAARFVPVPFLDDVVRQRARQVAVVRTLRAHRRDYPSELLRPLWVEGRAPGLLRRLRTGSGRVLLFPVRKYRALFGAVRGVPNDVMRVVLLGRTLDRALEAGRLADRDGAPREAEQLRAAFDGAVERMDLRLLTAALADGLSQSKGLSRSAVELARRRFGREDPEAVVEPDVPVAEGAQRVTEALDRPEVVQLLARFDAEVDRLLAAG